MRQSIDGFRPQRPASPNSVHTASQAAQRLGVPTKATPPAQRQPLKPGHRTQPRHAVRSIDGMVIQPPRRVHIPEKVEEVWQARPRVGFDTPTFINDPTTKGKTHTRASKFRKLLALLQYPLVAIFAVVAVYSTSIGQWFVLAYAIYAIVRRIESRNTFIGALVLLVAIPVFQLLNQPGVAEHIAVYTYELLVVGTVQAIIELILIRKRKQSMI